MVKKIISPFQEVLLQKRLCVGCTAPLDKAKRLGKLSERRDLVQCNCKRRYTFNKELNDPRWAGPAHRDRMEHMAMEQGKPSDSVGKLTNHADFKRPAAVILH